MSKSSRVCETYQTHKRNDKNDMNLNGLTHDQIDDEDVQVLLHVV